MINQEKFAGLKEMSMDDNEKMYGSEMRSNYVGNTGNKFNKKLDEMTQEQHNAITMLERELINTLELAIATGNPAGDLAQKAVHLHRQWLSCYWDAYSKNDHAGLAQLYVDTERFSVYYNKTNPKAADFLRNAIFVYIGMNNKKLV